MKRLLLECAIIWAVNLRVFMQSIRIAVLAFEGVSLFHLPVPEMVLGPAQSTPIEPQYVVNYFVESTGIVTSDQGIDLAVTHVFELMEESDVIVVPAWGGQLAGCIRVTGDGASVRPVMFGLICP